MAFSKIGLLCVAVSLTVLVYMADVASAQDYMDRPVADRPKCERKKRDYVRGCIKSCKRGQCGKCEPKDCNSNCWKKNPFRMKCDCGTCMDYVDCTCMQCGCQCKGSDALGMAAAQSFSYASTYSSASAEAAASASSEAMDALHLVSEMSDYVHSFSEQQQELAEWAFASSSIATESLSEAKCECDHNVMVEALAHAASCASAAAEASAVARAAASAYAEASAEAIAAAGASTSANARAVACASAEVEAGAASLAIAYIKIDADCNSAVAEAHAYAESAAYAASSAQACAEAVARTSASVNVYVRTITSIYLQVKTQVDVLLKLHASASTCAKVMAQTVAKCNSKCKKTIFQCNKNPFGSKCQFWVINQDWQLVRANTDRSHESGGNL